MTNERSLASLASMIVAGAGAVLYARSEPTPAQVAACMELLANRARLSKSRLVRAVAIACVEQWAQLLLAVRGNNMMLAVIGGAIEMNALPDDDKHRMSALLFDLLNAVADAGPHPITGNSDPDQPETAVALGVWTLAAGHAPSGEGWAKAAPSYLAAVRWVEERGR
jgi:hypothetical protein